MPKVAATVATRIAPTHGNTVLSGKATSSPERCSVWSIQFLTGNRGDGIRVRGPLHVGQLSESTIDIEASHVLQYTFIAIRASGFGIIGVRHVGIGHSSSCPK